MSDSTGGQVAISCPPKKPIEFNINTAFVVAVTGSRRRGLGYKPVDVAVTRAFHIVDSYIGKNEYNKYNQILMVHGNATGVDRTCKYYAEHSVFLLPWFVKDEDADWNSYGNAAGPIRNRLILDKYKPQLLLAFPDDQSTGTWGMVREAKSRKIRYLVDPID